MGQHRKRGAGSPPKKVSEFEVPVESWKKERGWKRHTKQHDRKRKERRPNPIAYHVGKSQLEAMGGGEITP